ncbi:MAG: signal recognition particle-docking protein FtsY [Rhodothalassiaceae bacterium]
MTEERKAGWLKRLASGLSKSTATLSDGISQIFTARQLDEDTLEDLEDLLISADLGPAVAAQVTHEIAVRRYDANIDADGVKRIVAAEVAKIVEPIARPLDLDLSTTPQVILVVGVNGSGKTTTIGKLARKFTDAGKSVMLAAGDTFRAAAIEQLQIWGERTGAPVVTSELKGDAAALAYRAVDRAIADKHDILMIDTAGRLQNRTELMDELAKIIRVIQKKLPDAPHHTLLVLDATTGQNAVNQIDIFSKVAQISGLVMTKLDGSARGGVLVAAAEKFDLPIHYIGVGEAVEDLQPFDAQDYACMLVGADRRADPA